MSKKGKRLREFEKKNKTFSVRENRRNDTSREDMSSEVITFEQRNSRSVSGTKKEKKKKKRVWNTRRLVTSGLIALFIVIAGISAFRLIKLNIERNNLVQKQAELNLIKEELTAELEHIDSAEYIEQQARKNLRLIKKNEILFVLPEDDSENTKDSDSGEEQTKDGQAEN